MTLMPLKPLWDTAEMGGGVVHTRLGWFLDCLTLFPLSWDAGTPSFCSCIWYGIKKLIINLSDPLLSLIAWRWTIIVASTRQSPHWLIHYLCQSLTHRGLWLIFPSICWINTKRKPREVAWWVDLLALLMRDCWKHAITFLGVWWFVRVERPSEVQTWCKLRVPQHTGITCM